MFLGGLWRYPYLLFPLLVWATLRFQQRGAATGSFVVVAVAGVVSGLTPLGGQDPRTEVAHDREPAHERGQAYPFRHQDLGFRHARG